MEEIGDELVIKLSFWKNEVEIDDLPLGMLEREKRWIKRRSHFIREKAILLRICEVIDLFHCTVATMDEPSEIRRLVFSKTA